MEEKFAGEYLGSLLESVGMVRVRMQVPVDNREIPLWSLPGDILPSVCEYLGLLGKMVSFPNRGLLVRGFWRSPTSVRRKI